MVFTHVFDKCIPSFGEIVFPVCICAPGIPINFILKYGYTHFFNAWIYLNQAFHITDIY